MHFKVTKARYQEASRRLAFTASGERNGVKFTIVTHVKCKDPKTPENIHLVATLRITEVFKIPSASGR